MTRHIIDQPRDHGGARLREFTRQDRESGTHPAALALHSRPRMRAEENRQAAEFLRIEREQMK